MGRWEPNAESRLQRAALELFHERGFDVTTVAEIAQRAGLTERTYFRYFADKREVFFWGSERLQAMLVDAVDGAPPSLGPLDAAARGIEAVAVLFEGRHADASARARLVAAHAELRERESIKLASLRAALTEALRRRGVAEHPASLAADMGIAVFHNAFGRWVAGDAGATFLEVARASLRELRAIATGA